MAKLHTTVNFVVYISYRVFFFFFFFFFFFLHSRSPLLILIFISVAFPQRQFTNTRAISEVIKLACNFVMHDSICFVRLYIAYKMVWSKTKKKKKKYMLSLKIHVYIYVRYKYTGRKMD